MDEKIVKVLNEMSAYLTIEQMRKLQEVIMKTFAENTLEKQNISNEDFMQVFFAAKQIEGCSSRTIKFYKTTLETMFSRGFLSSQPRVYRT